ncbi:uncharacterized protein LAESUDRAFT_721808 [Laetiporus sulphureus 93-53]|uniref:RBR-type E3 ubiquitin transferase n=1 Tax=Laetiporus sulphureus 93-53 TaxID=1314785 RepID=A0A165GJR3_9APHY|nr:uncharacterized protein LAESUDRAFT_721808 [Laetiporus sulphureus 93-53]KZT10449.1 hypothetical protein LAESUDRAFT_721808 [Laetiporus sulphureus 93-53]
MTATTYPRHYLFRDLPPTPTDSGEDGRAPDEHARANHKESSRKSHTKVHERPDSRTKNQTLKHTEASHDHGTALSCMRVPRVKTQRSSTPSSVIMNAARMSLHSRVRDFKRRLLPRGLATASRRPICKGFAVLRRTVSRVRPRRALRKLSHHTPTLRTFRKKKQHDCVVCQSATHGPHVRVACGHYYDVACLLDLIEASIRDESLFPPRCCQQRIREQSFARYMSAELAHAFEERAIEFETVRRVYCANPSCSRFLGPCMPELGARTYACSTCATLTCNGCRARVAPRKLHICRQDSGQRQVFALASQKGWARCPACDHMIELHSGCYEMKCVCGTRFCYACKAPWKTCACPRWEQVQLRQVGALDIPQIRPLSPLVLRRSQSSLRRQVGSPRPSLRASSPLSPSPSERSSRVDVIDVSGICPPETLLLLDQWHDMLPRSKDLHSLLLRGLVAQGHRKTRSM